MSTKKDASGRRSVQSEAIVPGTPEQVWDAIATGPGVSSWFVPCQIDGREGGQIVATFGPGMDSTSTITAWTPPQSFKAEGSDIGPGSPTMATEWLVEARSGGTCLVRVVHSWFAETDEWDSQFEGTEHGWPAFFRDLAVYLVHFDRQPSSTFQLMAFSTDSQEETWSKLTHMLGLAGKAVGERVESPEDAPKVAGEVNYVANGEILVLIDQPGSGIAHFLAIPMGGMACVSIRFFLYGSGTEETARKEEEVWSAWLSENFPMPVSAEA